MKIGILIPYTINIFKDIFSPKKCYSCRSEGAYLCKECFLKNKINQPYCYICKKKSNNYEIHNTCKNNKVYYNKIIILSRYNNKIIKRLIKDFKFYNKKDIGEDLGYYLSDLLIYNEDINKLDNFIIVSTPMYFLRKFKRGYNQADILAKYISNNTKIKYNKNIIRRIKNTGQQSKLSKEDRKHNLDSSFKINKKLLDKVDKKNVILVDDVVSTGSTLNKLSKILKENGAKKVIGLAIASG